jgi:CRP/FNR family transcriptional regulator, cyclic AMP receptor protein
MRNARQARSNFSPKRRRREGKSFDAAEFLAHSGIGKDVIELEADEKMFRQGENSEHVFYVQKGRIKISVVSKQGKEATLGLAGVGDFVGEECIVSPHSVRLVSATTLTPCVVLRINKQELVRVMKNEQALADVFVAFLVARNARTQADLVDHLFNSSEKRLARILLLLAQFGKDEKPETVIPKLSQEALAEMVGTTRSRVSFFMNRFRKMGFIKYNGEIQVNPSLLNVVLHD